jgi:hypothetical protein
MSKLSPRAKRYLFAEIFAVYYVCIVSGATLLRLPDAYEGYRNFAAELLVTALLISFFQSTLLCIHFSFKMPLKKAFLYTLSLLILGFIVFAIGGDYLASK